MTIIKARAKVKKQRKKTNTHEKRKFNVFIKAKKTAPVSSSAASVISPPLPRRKIDEQQLLRQSRGGLNTSRNVTQAPMQQQRERGGGAFSELQLTHVKNFTEEMMRDPYHIKEKKLQFFREFMDLFEEPYD
jgi:hypothetical protein